MFGFLFGKKRKTKSSRRKQTEYLQTKYGERGKPNRARKAAKSSKMSNKGKRR